MTAYTRALGAVSFGQIVKAGEPVFAAATNALLLKDIDHPMVWYIQYIIIFMLYYLPILDT